ncbi:MAG: efflux RND transporter periplasmic adaptor subunit [Planctomycetota bacterium]
MTPPPLLRMEAMKPLLVNDHDEIIEESVTPLHSCDGPAEERCAHSWDEQTRAAVPLSASSSTSGMDSAVTPTSVRSAQNRAFDRSHAISSPDLLTLRSRLLASTSLRELQNAAAQVAQVELSATMVAWFHPAGQQIGQTEQIEGILCPAGGISKTLHEQFCSAAQESLRRCEPVRHVFSGALTLYAMPIPGMLGHALLIVSDVAAAHPDSTRVGGTGGTVQTMLLLLTSWLSEWTRQARIRQAHENASTFASLIELVSHVQSSDSADSACQRLAEMLSRHLEASKVTVGLCRRGRTECRIAAMSGRAVIDPFSEETRLIESVLQESLIRAAGAVYPPLQSDNRHSLLSHQQLVESGFCESLVSMPIRTESGLPIGSILVSFDPSTVSSRDSKADIREAERFLRAGASSLAGCLSVLQKLADSRILSALQKLRSALTTSRVQMAGFAFMAVATLLMVPFNYRVNCSAELQPVERRYVAAPFAGPLEECLVEPGVVVSKDQLLARMDGREIRWELAEVQASLNKATKEKNTHVSNREFGTAAVLSHEIQRLEQRSQLLSHRNESLDIRSPSDGIVVSGDHREAEGVPLETGQTLFEIAPLDKMIVELRIPEEDVRHIQMGMTVYVQLDAVPENSIEAVVRIVHPRAEIHDGENVFIAEADVENTSGLFRPGMRGSGRVLTGRRPLGWNLFHKPVAWMLGWLGW